VEPLENGKWEEFAS
jgi:vacuolar protein sorting-associated protein 13A/C